MLDNTVIDISRDKLMITHVRAVSLIFVVFFFLSNPNLFGQNDIYFSKIGVEEGLSQLTVMTIFEDEFGRMWFGTREGISLYNGASIEYISPKNISDNTLSGSLVRNIVGDLAGSVFIQTQNGIDKYDLRTEKIFNLVKMQVHAISFGNNSLWYARGNKLYVHRDNGEELYSEVDENARITMIKVLSDNNIIVGTLSSGTYKVNSLGVSKLIIPNKSRVSSLFEDSNKNIWIGTWDEGLFRLGADGDIMNFKEENIDNTGGISSNFVRAVCEDDNGDIWIGTKLGLDKLDSNLSEFYHYNSSENSQNSLSNESVWSLCKDTQGNIWAGTYYGGINYFKPESNMYTFHDLHKGAFANRPFPIISQIIDYKDSLFFLCTEGSGLVIYDVEDKTYEIYEKLKGENIKSAYLDRENEILYLGLHLGGLCILDLQTYKLKCFPNISPELNQSNIVRKILPYRGKYLIATHNGLYLFDKAEESFAVFSTELHDYLTYFIDIDIDQDDNLWIASRGLYRYDISTKKVTTYFSQSESRNTISSNDITKILVDKNNNVWVGTSGGGVNLYNRESDNFTVFNSITSELNNDYISNIFESASGSFYITTTQGLSIISPTHDKIINLLSKGGFPLNSLYNGGINETLFGEIYVAGINGMVSFTDGKVLNELSPIKIHFTNLWVNNQRVVPGDQSRLLPVALPYAKRFKLNHNHSIARLGFSTDNLNAQDKYQYLYRIQGLSNHWITLREGLKEIDLINLTHGKYKLELKAVSPFSDTTLGQAEIDFKITPPFYKSVYAYILVFLFIVLLLIFYFRYLTDKINLKNSLEYQIKEKEHIEEVNRMKLQFFTNISHEFRTPLTLIHSQTEMILHEKKLTPEVKGQIKSIARNTRMMQRLINELLDFRKVINNRLTLRVGEYNIVAFIREITTSFEEYARYKDIEFTFNSSDDSMLMWFDPVQMQKVFFNLISNAFKYTPNQGKITVTITQSENNVSVAIEDNGRGISKENINKIFERFYQVSESRLDSDSQGTGLGLSLSKLIAHAHGADITVKSELGSGSRFEVTMLKGSSQFENYEIATYEDSDVISTDNIKEALPNIYEQASETEVNDNKEHTILIVEDNIELLNVLGKLFESSYNVIKAVNGEEGLGKTIEYQPDIVLSDLMMPVMSGNEMCLKIKSNFAVNHIPVVLLTAQTAVEYNIESLKFGADDYISKPFDANVLLARCNNLINGRKQLQEKFAKSTEFNSQTVASNEMDKNFLDKANQVIEENIDNPDFDINEFSKQMNLSRTGLFNKIKGVTGQTPNEFILNIKMKKATYLLVEKLDLNIADISYKLGFNSPKYFSKCFKEQFGISPSKFREMQ